MGLAARGSAAALLFVFFAAPRQCSSTRAQPPRANPTGNEPISSAPVAPPDRRASLFETSVRPILRNRCAPCHEPGGKMYAKLPFDDPAVVSSHADRVAGRLKNEEERRALENWVASLPPKGQ